MSEPLNLGQRIQQLQTENSFFSTEIQNLQKRLAEVRAQQRLGNNLVNDSPKADAMHSDQRLESTEVQQVHEGCRVQPREASNTIKGASDPQNSVASPPVQSLESVAFTPSEGNILQEVKCSSHAMASQDMSVSSTHSNCPWVAPVVPTNQQSSSPQSQRIEVVAISPETRSDGPSDSTSPASLAPQFSSGQQNTSRTTPAFDECYGGAGSKVTAKNQTQHDGKPSTEVRAYSAGSGQKGLGSLGGTVGKISYDDADIVRRVEERLEASTEILKRLCSEGPETGHAQRLGLMIRKREALMGDLRRAGTTHVTLGSDVDANANNGLSHSNVVREEALNDQHDEHLSTRHHSQNATEVEATPHNGLSHASAVSLEYVTDFSAETLPLRYRSQQNVGDVDGTPQNAGLQNELSHAPQPSPGHSCGRGDSVLSAEAATIDALKSENNRLTEQLVEQSLETAQHFESFSNDRNALLIFSQELRQQLQQEQISRSRLKGLLKHTQQVLESLAGENLLMAEELLNLLQGGSKANFESSRSGTSGAEELEELRNFLRQRTMEANATILEMAERNFELKEQLQSAHSALRKVQHSAVDSIPALPFTGDTRFCHSASPTSKSKSSSSWPELTMSGGTGCEPGFQQNFRGRGQAAPRMLSQSTRR